MLVFEEKMPESKTNVSVERSGPMIMRIARYITRVYNKHLTNVCLTASQHAILVVLAETDSIALQDLVDTLIIERSAMQRALQPLVRKNLVRSERDPSHKKRLLYMVTDAGKLKLQTAAMHVYAAEVELEKLLRQAIHPSAIPLQWNANLLKNTVD